MSLLSGVFDDDRGEVVAVPDTDLGALTSGWFPSAVGIGVLAAALTAGAPWLSRQWRRAGWFAGAVAVVLTGAPPRRRPASIA